MKRLLILLAFSLVVALILAACGNPSPTDSNAKPSTVPTSQPVQAYTSKTHEGGGVTTTVTPQALVAGQPVAFKVVMDTHSVDLKDDMVKASFLRDDTGKQYQPTTWDGAGAGGHHREGSLKFAPLAGSTKFVELVITGVAGVPERVFKWELE